MERYAQLLNTNRIDYYDCVFATLLVQKPYDRRVWYFLLQDKLQNLNYLKIVQYTEL